MFHIENHSTLCFTSPLKTLDCISGFLLGALSAQPNWFEVEHLRELTKCKPPSKLQNKKKQTKKKPPFIPLQALEHLMGKSKIFKTAFHCSSLLWLEVLF